jgi:hypothetical protein
LVISNWLADNYFFFFFFFFSFSPPFPFLPHTSSLVLFATHQPPPPYEMHETEAALGFTQLIAALTFCHNDADLVHGDVAPEDVFLTPKGDWKLGGFHFSSPSRYVSGRLC